MKNPELKPLDIDKMGEQMRADTRNTRPVVKEDYRGPIHDYRNVDDPE